LAETSLSVFSAREMVRNEPLKSKIVQNNSHCESVVVGVQNHSRDVGKQGKAAIRYETKEKI